MLQKEKLVISFGEGAKKQPLPKQYMHSKQWWKAVLKVLRPDGSVDEIEFKPARKIFFQDMIDFLREKGIHQMEGESGGYSLKLYRITGR